MKTYYICHYCIEYKTESLSDMIKHYKRKNKCNCNTLFSYEDSIFLSRKKYIFNKNIDIENLSKDDYLYIITHYLDSENIINKNFIKNNNIVNNNIVDNNIVNNDNNNDIVDNDNNNNIVDNDNNKSNIIQYKPESKSKITKYYDNIYFNKKTNMYICGNCESEYSYLHNLKRHLEKNTCTKRVEKIKVLDNYKKNLNNIIEKEKEIQAINNTYIGTQNNNIQNNNNPQNNTYNFSMKDFANEHYDLSHLNDDFYAKKDFFLYPIFLDAIMQNKKNHNIFFAENEAIVYTDNELSKMDSDKAGYLVLDKLNQSVEQLFYKNDQETQDYYSFIKKYYHVIRGHYKHDTISKDYDINTRSFTYTSNSSMFRSRDRYLNKIISSINRVKNSTRENMNINLHEIKDIQKLNPNIEDYCSVRNRYRDLKDKNSF